MRRLDKYLILALIWVLSVFSINAQCPNMGEYACFTQLDVDSFNINYPDCEELNTLYLSGNDISYLNSFENLGEINYLVIDNTLIQNCDDMNVKITGAIEIRNNKELVDISSLSFSQDFGFITLIYNDKLTVVDFSDIVDFNSLQIISEDMQFSISGGNPEHVDLNGEIELSTVEPIDVIQNFSLSNGSYYNSFESINNDFVLDSIRLLWISQMDSFSFSGFISNTYIQDDFALYLISNLDTSGLSGVEFYSRQLRLGFIDNLVDLSAFSGAEINKIILQDLPKLESLDGLEFTSPYLDEIDIKNNPVLVDLSGLENMRDSTYSQRLIITNNEQLSDCAIDPICKRVINYGDEPTVIIENNFGNCIDEPTLIEACITPVNENTENRIVSLYPNPSSNIIHFTSELIDVSIFDSSGSLVYQNLEPSIKIDVSKLVTGVYHLKGLINGTGKNYSSRFIKV